MTLREMEEKDIDIGCLYRMYHNYKYLYEYWQKNRNSKIRTTQEIRDRMKYILENNGRQRDEISTLCWILGEEDVRTRK